jgi:hypothetical protein
MSRTNDELAAMGLAGRRLIATRHDWTKVAGDMAAAYHWLINRGNSDVPECVVTNGVAG